MIDEFEVREVMGVRKGDGALEAREFDEAVGVVFYSPNGIQTQRLTLTIHEARKFAQQINRMARRVEARNG